MIEPAESLRRVPLIGLIGGIASGKSLVAEELRRLGAAVIDGDQAGHEVLRLPRVKQAVRQRWGEKVFDADGEVRRAAVASIVFAAPPEGPKELEFLEQLTHPLIGELLARQVTDLAADSRTRALVLDAPLMVEAGWVRLCDVVLFVDASREIRLSRARQRGWSEGEFDAREGVQEALSVKRELADVVIDNSGSPEATAAQLERFWRDHIG